jgi:hypothetical protein
VSNYGVVVDTIVSPPLVMNCFLPIQSFMRVN